MFLFLCLCVPPILCGPCGLGVELPLFMCWFLSLFCFCLPQTVLLMFMVLCLCVCRRLFLYLCVCPTLCGLCGPGVELPLQQLREVARPSWELGHHQRELVTTTK